MKKAKEGSNSVLKDMWIAFRKDDRPHWAVMADDSVNKVLKTAVYCLFGYGAYVVIVEIWQKFFV